METIVLISPFASIDVESSSRTLSIATVLINEYKVECISTDFDHAKKEYKQFLPDEVLGIKCKYLHVPAYKTNVSIKRLFSHIVFAFRLKKLLRNMKNKPIGIYCAMPTSTASFVSGRYCKQNKIKFVIDVIDLWPDSLLPILKGVGRLLNVFLYPWKFITKSSYKMADIILGESKKYVEVAACYNNTAVCCPIYLGVDVNSIKVQIEKSDLKIIKPKDELWICYGGSLGTSYDFDTLISNVAYLNGKYKYKLLFIGDGTCRGKIEQLIKFYSVNALITGFVEYKDYLKYLTNCDIAVNIFRKNTRVVHSYKFNDYVATNCFIMNSLVGETSDMVNEYKIGLNFDFGNNDLGKKLVHVFEEWEKYSMWRSNNKQLISECLDKKKIYSVIPCLIKQ